MKNKKRVVVTTLILALLMVVFMFIGFVVPAFSKELTIADTTEFSATFKSIEIFSNDSGACVIQTQNNGKLHLRKDAITINIQEIENLEVGEVLFFRIDNSLLEGNDWDKNIIVSLKTSVKTFATLESYNACMNNDKLKIKITASIIIFVVLLAFVNCVLLLNGINIFKCRRALCL